MKHTFKRAMSLFMALAMVLTMVPSFGTHVHAEELETEPVVMTEEPATEAPVVEAPETEAAETEAPTQAPETEAPATEAPVVETEAPEVTEEAPEVVETEPAEETEAIEESFPEEILEEEIVEEEAVAAIETHPLSTISGLYAEWTDAANSGGIAKGSASWSASGTGITGTATGYENSTMGVAVTTTLTLKNVSGGEAKLSFDYSLNDGSASVADSEGNKVSIAKNTSGSYAKVLAADDAITITLTSAKAKPPRANELKITGMSLISTSAAPVTTTFVPAVEGGTYSVNGVEVTAETSEEVVAGTKFTLTAVAGEGYVFFGWYDMSTNTCLDYNAEYAYTASQDGAEIVAKFVTASTALFGVGAAKFYSLTEAGAFAESRDTKLIVLLNDGVVTGSHSIPAGTTLLIPFDDKNTVYTDTPACTNTDSQHEAEWVRPTAYRTLELAAGATISVSGSISISAKHFAGGSGRNAASPTENVGFVKMGSGSQITLNSGANLYAWGFVTGSGKVIAKSGAKVYENFQVRDFRGGGATSAMATDFIVFPMTQYYVQNIEVPVTFEYGAEEHVYTSLFMSGRAYSAGVKFIGDKAMFRPEEGCKLTKDYIESRDRLQLSVEGTASLASLTLSVEGVADIDSSVFLLPINSNITIEILSGTTTLCQDVSLLPGVELTVAQGAVLNVASGKGSATIESGTGSNVFVYDADEWNYGLVWDEEIEDLVQDNTVGYVYPNTKFVALDYVPGRTYTRTTADLKDVKLDINGTLVADGFLYTTAGGANITSSEKCGVVAMNSGAGEETFTYQAIQIDTIPVYCALPVASAQLRNGDGTYLDTTGAKPGATYNYCARGDHWFLGDECAVVHGVEITWANLGFTNDYTEEFAIDAIPVYKSATPTKATANCKAYTFAGWKDQDGKEYPIGTALPAATVDATYFAYFTESDAHIDEDMDHLCDNCDTQISECEYGEPEYVWPSVDTCIAALMCKYCDEGIVNTVEATVSEIPATCMAKGSITYTATFAVEWAETQTKTVEVEKNPENHTKQNTTVKDAVEATCGAEGYTGDTYCECGVVIETGETIPATGNHNYVNEVARTAATCMAEGSVTNKCACGAEKTEVLPIDKTNHTKQNTTVKDAVEATCGAEGYTGDTYCECGVVIETGETIPATGNHNYVTEVGRTAATCMAEGSVTKKCACGAQITETLEIDPTNHTGKNHFENAVSETCGEDGYEGDIVCECGVKVGTGKTIPATGNHNYVTEVGRTAATCMAEGSVTKKCACGAQITETLEIDPTNHTGKNHFENAVSETCGKDGYEGDIVCECGVKVGTGKTIPATGEHFDAENDGDHICDNGCGEVKSECWGGVSYCNAKANCEECGEPYGDIDPGYHASEEVTYEDCEDGTHNVIHKCCNQLGWNEEHYYEGENECTCICGNERIITIHFYVDGELVETVSGVYGTPVTVPDYEAPVGYRISEPWQDVPEFLSADVDNLDYNAYLERIEYKLILTINGEYWGEGIYWYGDTVDDFNAIYVENELLEGYTFSGWDLPDTMPAEDITLDATLTVNEYILTIEYLAIDEDGELYWDTMDVSVPYGARLIEVEEVAGLASEIYVNASDNKGVFVLDSYAFGPSKDELTGGFEIEEETMPASDAWLSAEYIFTGWANYGEGWVYEKENEIWMTGWTAFDDGEDGKDWYYLDPETGIRAEGVARVPYPSEPINGFKYGPNAEDMANTDYNYPDATEAWFVFASGTENGENDGKFLNNYSGPANTDKTLISWAVKGMIPWHVGMVQLDENVYAYFIGDEVNGGNVMATGDVYVIRVADNCERAFAIGGIYTFGENGLLIDNHGIVDMGNGTKRYYQNAQLMAGAGLVEVPIDNNDNYAFIFVRGNGELVVNTKYWVGANSQNIVPGLYAFDENGYMINPAPADKNGVFAEDGALYFYENGKRTYKGLIEYGDGIIYVTTSGKLATGKYYVTKTDLIEGYEPGFYFFDAEGYMEITTRNGIVDGKFYVDGEVQYGAGLIEYNDGMIYVKSNGQVVMDQAYWITNTNNLLPAGCYEFDSEGYLQIDESLDGVIGLNYYIDGVKQFGNGLVQVEDGYIYVKTNGELATGTYWITRTNGLMSAGCYEFDTDGYMILG